MFCFVVSCAIYFIFWGSSLVKCTSEEFEQTKCRLTILLCEQKGFCIKFYCYIDNLIILEQDSMHSFLCSLMYALKICSSTKK